ncbi:MAG: hybrid sensor histidine kinase/response regulator [Bacteroidota bacterium]|nr:hybrid sensor histidine kinase/response regulator [Bacteroidota bacterium]
MDEYKNAKILIADDEPANIFLLEGILTEEGYNVVSANNGFECLDALQEYTPDIILLDIMMPKLDGLEVLNKILADNKLKHIPVVIVTAKTDSEDIEEALSIGAVEYIKKPIDEIELLARIKTVLRLKFQEDKLRDLVKSKDDFIRMVSHDVRTPFYSISGFTEILINDKELKSKLSEDHKEFLNYILSSTNFVVDYFNKLLTWSKLGNEKLEIIRKNESLNNLINSSIIVYQNKINEKNIKLDYETKQEFEVNIDKTYFTQAINNIISNAIKFTPENGKITISTEQVKGNIVIKISDSGIGMPDISIDNFFNKNYNTSRKGTSGEKGTGTGMIICKKIIDAHNFYINFVSKKNKGTSFIITIPH